MNWFLAALETHPNTAIVLKEADQTGAIGEEWHTDHAYDEIPALGSILHAIETPPFGGDTAFCSMGAAYDALTPGFKGVLEGQNAWHLSRHVFGQSYAETDAASTGRIGNASKATQDALHLIVIKHPMSGRKGHFINPQFTTQIDGLSKPKFDAILNVIYTQCQKPEFQCRVRWQAGDVTMWGNRATCHKAINDYCGHRRYMHRVTIEGSPLEAA